MNYSVFYRNLNNNSVNNNSIISNLEKSKLEQSKQSQTKLDEKTLQIIKAKDKNEFNEKKIQEQKNEVINSFYFDDFF